jgi:hypothetical protein
MISALMWSLSSRGYYITGVITNDQCSCVVPFIQRLGYRLFMSVWTSKWGKAARLRKKLILLKRHWTSVIRKPQTLHSTFHQPICSTLLVNKKALRVGNFALTIETSTPVQSILLYLHLSTFLWNKPIQDQTDTMCLLSLRGSHTLNSMVLNFSTYLLLNFLL